MCFVWLDAFSYLWTELNLAFSFFSTSQPVLALCEWAIIVCRGWTAYLSPEILMVYFTNSTCCQRNSCSGKFRCSFLCLSNWDSENHSDLSLCLVCGGGGWGWYSQDTCEAEAHAVWRPSSSINTSCDRSDCDSGWGWRGEDYRRAGGETDWMTRICQLHRCVKKKNKVFIFFLQ